MAGPALTAHAATPHHIQEVSHTYRRGDEDPEQPGGAQAGTLRILRRDPAGGEASVAAAEGSQHRVLVGALAVAEVQKL